MKHSSLSYINWRIGYSCGVHENPRLCSNCPEYSIGRRAGQDGEGKEGVAEGKGRHEVIVTGRGSSRENGREN